MRHELLDFPHAAAWCSDCREEEQRSQQITEMRRANDLKERELNLREGWAASEPRPQPKPRYIPPPPALPSAPKVKGGGMSVEPRIRSTS